MALAMAMATFGDGADDDHDDDDAADDDVDDDDDDDKVDDDDHDDDDDDDADDYEYDDDDADGNEWGRIQGKDQAVAEGEEDFDDGNLFFFATIGSFRLLARAKFGVSRMCFAGLCLLDRTLQDVEQEARPWVCLST